MLEMLLYIAYIIIDICIMYVISDKLNIAKKENSRTQQSVSEHYALFFSETDKKLIFERLYLKN